MTLNISAVWQPVRLTIELASLTTTILLVLGTALEWWLARSSRWKEVAAAFVAIPLVLPSTVLGFYLLVALGPNGPGGKLAAL